MKRLDPLPLDADFPIVVETMKYEARQAEALLDRCRGTKVPRRFRRRIDAHLERASLLRRELHHRDRTDSLREERDRLRTALSDRLAEPVVQPQRWENLREAMELIEGMLREDPGARAQAEIVTAYVVDVMRGIGLDPHRPDVLYAVLSGAGLVTELAANGQAKGEVDPAVVVSIARIVQTLTAALIPYLPPEEKPDLELEIPDTIEGLLEAFRTDTPDEDQEPPA